MVDSNESTGMGLLALLDQISMYRRTLIRTFDAGQLGLSINNTQERVLMVILKMPELKMKDLSEQVGLEKSTLTRVIDSLIEEGLVARCNDMQDRRKINCSLTEKGLLLAGKIEKLMAQHIENCFSQLSKEGRGMLMRNLKSAIDTLSIHVKE